MAVAILTRRGSRLGQKKENVGEVLSQDESHAEQTWMEVIHRLTLPAKLSTPSTAKLSTDPVSSRWSYPQQR